MNLTKKQYRMLDLTVFAVLIGVFEAVNLLAVTQWFTEELFTISLLIPLVAIVIMRWGAYGIIHAVISGAAYCLILGATWQQYLIYVVGNCFCGLVLLLFLGNKKQKIAANWWATALYVASILLFVEIGRTLVALCLGQNITVFVSFISADILSAVIGLAIVLIARKQNGLFEDQNQYLLRLQEEREQQRKLKDQGM